MIRAVSVHRSSKGRPLLDGPSFLYGLLPPAARPHRSTPFVKLEDERPRVILPAGERLDDTARHSLSSHAGKRVSPS